MFLMQKKNIFVMGLDEADHSAMFKALNYAEDCIFHPLLDGTNEEADTYSAVDLFAKAEQQLEKFEGKVDGILNALELPYNLFVPELSRKFGVRCASSRSVMQCEHKYWSRMEQRASIPESIPAFFLLDPFDDNAHAHLNLSYPFWIKPVKSFSSYLAFKVACREDLEKALSVIRENIHTVAEPFDALLNHLSFDMPHDIRDVSSYSCLIESVLSGHQCTLEGCMKDGVFYAYGVIDSLCYPDTSSFFAYQYPSIVPEAVQHEMAHIGERFLRHIDFDNAAFNIEFFWDKEKDTLGLLEINPRIASGHNYIFQKVNGVSNIQAPLNIALNHLPVVQGSHKMFRVAASFFHRVFQNAWVEAIPNEADIAEIEAALPESKLVLYVSPDKYLSDYPEQDSYSYVTWRAYLGADSRAELLEKYRMCEELVNAKLKLHYCD
jgi:biotin carboxylase